MRNFTCVKDIGNIKEAVKKAEYVKGKPICRQLIGEKQDNAAYLLQFQPENKVEYAKGCSQFGNECHSPWI